MKLTFITIAVLACLTPFASDALGHGKDVHDYYPKPKPYPLDKCLVTDEKLSRKPHVFAHQRQEIKLCCKSCRKEFKKDPAKYLSKLNASK